MTEHTLLNDWLIVVRRALGPVPVVWKHNDMTAGLPDVSLTFGRVTSWWECKLALPVIVGTELQNLTARRLAREGVCRYLVWTADTTEIVLPRLVRPDGTWEEAEFSTPGHDHRFALRIARLLHGRMTYGRR